MLIHKNLIYYILCKFVDLLYRKLNAKKSFLDLDVEVGRFNVKHPVYAVHTHLVYMYPIQ
jgi:hypothetical protein